MFLGSSCVYPKLAPQPIREEHLLTGPLEPTNHPVRGGEDRGDRDVPRLPPPVRHRVHRRHADQRLRSRGQLRPRRQPRPAGADPQVPRRRPSPATPSVVVWGSGTPRREFLHVDDLADACVFLMEQPFAHDLVNIGTGIDYSIEELARKIAFLVGFEETSSSIDRSPTGRRGSCSTCTPDAGPRLAGADRSGRGAGGDLLRRSRPTSRPRSSAG